MIEKELRTAINSTLKEIMAVKHQLDRDTDPREVRLLKKRLKELQYLQLWQLEQLENLPEED